MSRENLEVVRRAFSPSATQGLEETANRYWDPDLVYVEDPRWPGASRYDGRGAVIRCFQGYLEALGPPEDWTISVERVVDAGERQVAFVRLQGRGSISGVPHEHVWGYVAEVKGGRITYFRAYYEPQEALEAVGLRE
jgi:ketosteroid isomerase-like protein